MALTIFGCAERSPQQQVIPAILHNDGAKVEALLNDNAHVDVNWRAGGGGITALISAAGRNRLEIAALLLKRGADPNLSTADGWSPILMATQDGGEEMVRLLLAFGANPNTSETRYGATPLIRASSKGHTEIVKMLLDAGADRNARTRNGRDAASFATRHGHMEILQMLTTYVPGSAKSPGE